MIKILKTSGICISRNLEEETFYQEIKRELTRHSKGYQTSEIVTNNFFLEGSNILKIPRYFPIEEYIKQKYEIIDKLNQGQDIKINHNITLRDELQKNIVSFMLNHKNGIIQANPGSGKTVVSVFVVSSLKKKTFILVHRDSLAEQWTGPGTEDKKQGFLGYTDLPKDEIGRLSSSNFKDVLKKSIIICTDQTFTSILRKNRDEFLIELNQANIGIFIADEVHTTVGAPTFAECSIHIPAIITFGLSATPYRYDNNTDIIKYHLGEVYVPEGKSSTMDCKVTILLFNFGFIPKSYKYIYWGGFFQRSRYLTILKNSKIFMDITNTLLEKFERDGRNIIFMGERVKLLEYLYKQSKNNNKGLFVGSASLKEIEPQTTYATPGKMRDGVDAVSKDCLILTSPISNIEQMCGRVLRIKEGKQQPIICDMVDIGISEIKKTLFTRLEFYKKKNWEIQFFFISSLGEKRILEEKEVLEILKD